MISSNVVSRILPAKSSVYEAIRDHEEEDLEDVDLQDRQDDNLDERNLGERFRDDDIGHLLAEAAGSQLTSERGTSPDRPRRNPSSPEFDRRSDRPRWMRGNPHIPARVEEDDDVPESLLLEHDRDHTRPSQPSSRNPTLPPPVPGPTNRGTRIQWDTTRAQQRLYEDDPYTTSKPPATPRGLVIADPAEKAMWRWTNVENLDNFLLDVYDYYLGKGIWSIILQQLLALLTSAFVVGFSTFLLVCVDYSKIPYSKRLPQILVPQCTKNMSGFSNLLIWLFSFLWIAKLFQYVIQARSLWHMHEFYTHLLGIPDVEMQTVTWQEIVARLMDLRDANPRTALNMPAQSRKFIGEQSKQRMDAHDIANRLMRRDNYLIALFNKDILDLTLKIPYLRDRQLFSRTLEWNIKLCVMDYVFNERSQVRQIFLKDTHRQELIEALRRRFLFAGVMNVICAPFILTYLVALYFLRYFTEFQKNPSQLGSRSYTPLAEWKFREFNELAHLFQKRANMSYPFASRYIDQFPKDKTVQAARFVAFVTGAVAAVLAVASLLDPESFFGFEISPDRTVLFYIGVCGTVWAVARGMVPEDNLVYDPEYAMRNVIDCTHFEPSHWKGRLHTDEVRREFSVMYQTKIIIFLEEMLSIIFTPFVLWFSLPDCSERLVDFFREFTIHVDGLGYICSFAMFDFKSGASQGTKTIQQETAASDPREDYYSTKDGKMMASYYSFLDSYANNTKYGNPNRIQRHFQPPPAFPGLPSPQRAVQGRMTTDRIQNRKPTVSSPVQRASGSRVLPSHTSPSPSLLLDPHHQPSGTISRRPYRQTTQVRHRQPPESFIEQDEEDYNYGSEEAARHHLSSSAIAEEESTLGDSWKAAKAGAADPEGAEAEETADVTGSDKGAGVLGLLYQFQKGQTEGRAAGVNL